MEVLGSKIYVFRFKTSPPLHVFKAARFSYKIEFARPRELKTSRLTEYKHGGGLARSATGYIYIYIYICVYMCDVMNISEYI